MHETLQSMSALSKHASFIYICYKHTCFLVFVLLFLTFGCHLTSLVPVQLGGVHADGQTADMNVSAVALAAVDIAATALDSALLSVERTVERSQQRPEVIVTKQHDAGLQQACWSWQSRSCVFADLNLAGDAAFGMLST